MIISGGSRSNWRFFAGHLIRADENERVTLVEMRGAPEVEGDLATSIREALRDYMLMASRHCKNAFYHADLNPRAGEHLTPEQWEQAANQLEHELKLDGQPRFIVEHEKQGRVHRHIVWSRIDEDGHAISDSNNFAAHERAARALEKAFGHEPVRGVHAERDGKARPERRPKNREVFRGHASGIDPAQVKAEVSALWRSADSGKAFAQALADAGYILARGDRRDYVIVDAAGDDHSLARRVEGAKAAQIRERMADVDRARLPTVLEARMLARDHRAEAQEREVPPAPDERELTPEPDRRKDADTQAQGPPQSDPASQEQRAPEKKPDARDRFETVADAIERMPDALDAWPPGVPKPVGDAAPEQHTRGRFDAAADAIETALAANGGEPVMPGLSAWEHFAQRLASWRETFAEVAERVTDWVREQAHEVTGAWQKYLGGRHGVREQAHEAKGACSGDDYGKEGIPVNAKCAYNPVWKLSKDS
jgi:hypothetical protein